MAKPASVSSAASFIIWMALASIVCMSAKAPFALAQVRCSTSSDSPAYDDAEQAVNSILEQNQGGEICTEERFPWDCRTLASHGTTKVNWCASISVPCIEYGERAKEILAKCAKSVNGRDVVSGNNTWKGGPLPPGPSRNPYVEIVLSDTNVLSSVV